jgi:hypothetical protein
MYVCMYVCIVDMIEQERIIPTNVISRRKNLFLTNPHVMVQGLLTIYLHNHMYLFNIFVYFMKIRSEVNYLLYYSSMRTFVKFTHAK